LNAYGSTNDECGVDQFEVSVSSQFVGLAILSEKDDVAANNSVVLE
jgi:hypothetical protein